MTCMARMMFLRFVDGNLGLRVPHSLDDVAFVSPEGSICGVVVFTRMLIFILRE